MPQPKKKHTSSRQGHRRAHWLNDFQLPNLVSCPQCRAPKLSHTLCQSCKTYKGRQYGVPAGQA